MKIVLATAGSRGDVQPYVALGKGLAAHGHDVRVLATDDFEGLVTDAGLTFCSTGANVQQIMEGGDWEEITERGNFLVILQKMRGEMKKVAASMTPRMLEGSRGADLMIGGLGVITGGFSVAEKLNMPAIVAHVFPFDPTSEFASPITPDLPFGNALNRLSFHAGRQMFWQTMRISDVIVRQTLDMPPASFFGPYRKINRERIPTFYGYSRHVLPKPADWGEHVHVTGYWFLEADADWSPPDDLLAFLNAGDPPVYIGFGSMRSGDPAETGRIALEALERSGQRGILSKGWGGLTPSDLPDTVHTVGSMPHTWLFPQMSAVVHHGGAGTTAAGLRAGVPSIIVPFMGDQPFWGKRIADLGVGPDPIPRKQLTADNLADAITRAVSDAGMRAKAADLGAKICDENGVEQAAELVRILSGEAMRVT